MLGVLGAVSHKAPWLWWTTALVHTVFPIMFAVMLAHVIEARPRSLTVVLGVGFLRFFGKYSYGIYVWHGLMLPLFAALLPVTIFEVLIGNRLAGVLSFTVVATVISVMAALVSWTFVESPFLRLKSRFQ
jgi:peptidoglycan/LPS O-acetylase OafA/YrhL